MEIDENCPEFICCCCYDKTEEIKNIVDNLERKYNGNIMEKICQILE
jgi:hypothetical protein